MARFLLEFLSVLLIAVYFYALIRGFSRWRQFPHRTSLLWWGGLVAVLFAINPASRIFTVPAAALIAYGVWRRTRSLPRFEDDPGPLILRFCTRGSVMLAGGLAGLMIAVLLYTLGLLQSPEYWSRQSAGRAVEVVIFSFAFGAILGFARQRIRAAWPRPVFVPHSFVPGGNALQTQEGQGFWADELILPLAATPFLWYALVQVHSGWSAVFIFGLALPTFGFYLLWTFFHTAWLRWIGVVNERDRAVFQAYEVLIKDQFVQPWLGDVIVEFDPRANRYEVTGTLPGTQELATVRKRLREIGGAEVSDSVRIDPELIPNPWYQQAIEKRERRRGHTA